MVGLPHGGELAQIHPARDQTEVGAVWRLEFEISLDVGAWTLGAFQLPRARPSPFFMQLACHTPDRITAPENLNFSRECRMQIYAIYFQKTGVGRGSARKNSLKNRIAPWLLMIIGITRRVARHKMRIFWGIEGFLKMEIQPTSTTVSGLGLGSSESFRHRLLHAKNPRVCDLRFDSSCYVSCFTYTAFLCTFRKSVGTLWSAFLNLWQPRARWRELRPCGF